MRPFAFITTFLAAASIVVAAPVRIAATGNVIVGHGLYATISNITGHRQDVDAPSKRAPPPCHANRAPPKTEEPSDSYYVGYDEQVFMKGPQFEPEPAADASHFTIAFKGMSPLAAFNSINKFLPFGGSIPSFKFSVPIPHIALPFDFGGSLSAVGQGLKGLVRVVRVYHGKL